MIEPELLDNGQLIMHFENKIARKVLEYTAKKKVWCNNLYAPMQAPLFTL